MGDEEEEAPPPPVVRYRPPPLSMPDAFDFSDPGKWGRWSARWRRYRDASGLKNQPEGDQINSLLYILGDQAEDIMLSRGITEDTHDNVLKAFDTYFGLRRNIIAERAKFNKMMQNNDGMDVFINKIHRQAEYCDYKTLKEELIRDRLVVGVKDDELSEKLKRYLTSPSIKLP